MRQSSGERGIASASRLLQELPVARDLGFREARRGPFPQFRLQASLKQLLHQLWRRISVQNITGGHADLDAIFTYLQLKNRAALIIDASLRLGLQLLPYLVDIRSRLVRKGAGQKVFQLLLVGPTIFASTTPCTGVLRGMLPGTCEMMTRENWSSG